MGIDLPLIWAVIIFFGVMMYVVMDGFDLGIGMLYLFVPAKHDRDVMMNTVAPVWDGNETWLVLGAAVLLLLRSLKTAEGEQPHATPFLCALGVIFLGYTGLAISIWPNIIPPHISIWDASSPPQSQGFTLVGTLLIVPLILGYTAWSYYVFRGKVKHDDHYH